MSDDIEVTSGGAVAVDTVSLERAAAGLDALGDDIDRLATRVSGVAGLLDAAAVVSGGAGVHRARRAASELGDARGRAAYLASALRESARIYEIVELTNERDLAIAAGDGPRARDAAAQLRLARAADPAAAARADDAVRDGRLRWAENTVGDLRDPLLPLDPLGAWAAGVVAAFAIRTHGGGLVPRGRTPAGPAPAVALTPFPIAPRTPVGAPSSLAAMIQRIPDGDRAGLDADGDARVRVERYDLPDGSREFAVYIEGTHDFLGDGGDEAWDLRSNVQLYHGYDSASYEAVRAALVASGAEPGDALDLVGFSQGGMIASWLAQDATYDVRSLVTAGSPTMSDLPPGTPYLSLDHTDDVVDALQGVWDVGVSAPDTVTVQREIGLPPGIAGILPAHDQDRYARTAALFEASGDPRVEPFLATLDRLRSATAVTTVEYGVTRVR